MSNALIALLQSPPPGACALTILETDRQSPGEFILDGLRSMAGDLIATVLAGGGESGGGDSPTLYFHVGWFISPQHPFAKVVIRQRGPETLLAILPPACAAARDRRLPVDFIGKDQPPCRLDPWLPAAALGAEQLAKERWSIVKNDALRVSHASRENAPLWLRLLLLPLVLGAVIWFWWVALIVFVLSRKTALGIWGQVKFLAVGANVRWDISIDAATLTARREDESNEQFVAPLHEVLHVAAIGKPRALWLISPRQAVIWRLPSACAASADADCVALAELLRGDVLGKLKARAPS